MNRENLIKNKPENIYLIKGIWRNLSGKRKFQILIISLLNLCSGVAEMFTLASVVPFLSVISNREQTWQLPLTQKFVKLFNIQDPNILLLTITIIFTLIAIIAGLFRILNLWVNYRFAGLIGIEISCNVYRKILYQKYDFHLNRNQSSIVATTTVPIDMTKNLVENCLLFLTSFFIVIFISSTLLILNPKLAIFTCLFFGSIYLIMSKFVRKRLNLNSKIVSAGINKQMKNTQEGLGSIRDILLDGNQKTYLAIYRKSEKLRWIKEAESQFLSTFLRYALEALGIVLISTLAIFLNLQEGDSPLILPTLGTLALASQRLLPNLNMLFSSWARIKYNSVAIKQVLEILDLPIQESESQLIRSPLKIKKNILFNNVAFSYSNNSPSILKSIDLEICPEDRIGIVGKTGSGKSTLVDILMGLLEPTAGKLLVDNKNIHDPNYPQRLAKWRSAIAHVPQNVYLADRTIAENIAFGLRGNEINMNRVKNCAKQSYIDKFIENNDYGYNAHVGERGIKLSGGQCQRIGIARALYKNAKILILDEATSALDSYTEKVVMDRIIAFNKEVTIVIIAHRESTLKDCNKIIKIRNGQIIRIK